MGLALMLATTIGAAAAAPQDCKLMRIEEWPVRLERNLPIIDGEINGQKVGILLDTGAERSVVTRSAATRLMLSRYDLASTRLYAVTDRPIEAVRVDELRIGPAMRKNWSVLLAAEQDFGGDVSLILGEDFFSAVDVEFDFPNRTVRLFQPKDCEGVSLAYWSRGGTPGQAALEGGAQTTFTVAVNGRPLRAQLDTGATVSALAMADAARLGVTTKSPGASTAGCSIGIGRKPVDYWSAPFESFAIGNEIIRNPTLRFGTVFKNPGPFAEQPQMVLGVDFLRAHRVYVARSQRKLYFTYTGGTVFPLDAAKGCQDLR
jgi:predicted aspartyl protease